MANAVPKLIELKPRIGLVEINDKTRRQTLSDGASSPPLSILLNEEENAKYQQIFEKPLDALPCHKDLPRLARQITVEGAKLNSDESSSLLDVCKTVLIQLNDEFGESEELSEVIAQRYSEYVSEDSADDLALGLLKFFQEVIPESAVIRVLKASNQSIIAPAVTRVKKLFEDAGLPFNSVRNGWRIHIERKWDEVVIRHCKRETATPEGESGNFGVPYNFEWSFALTMDDTLKTVKGVVVDIISTELPYEGEPPKGSPMDTLSEDQEHGEDELEFKALLSEMIQCEFNANKLQAQVLFKSIESKFRKIRAKRDKRIKRSKRKKQDIKSSGSKLNGHSIENQSVLKSRSLNSVVGSDTKPSESSISPTGSPPTSTRDIGSSADGIKKKSGFASWLRIGNHADAVDFSNSMIEQIPVAKLLHNPSTREVNLSHNIIATITASCLQELTEGGFGVKLTILNLSHNQLRTIPKEIKLLSKLTTLILAHNHLQELPRGGFESLSELTSLDLSFNRLRALPKEIGSMTKLTTLNVEENPLLIFPPPETIKMGTVSILSFLSSGTNPLSLPTTRIEAGLLGLPSSGRRKLQPTVTALDEEEPQSSRRELDLQVQVNQKLDEEVTVLPLQPPSPSSAGSKVPLTFFGGISLPDSPRASGITISSPRLSPS